MNLREQMAAAAERGARRRAGRALDRRNERVGAIERAKKAFLSEASRRVAALPEKIERLEIAHGQDVLLYCVDDLEDPRFEGQFQAFEQACHDAGVASHRTSFEEDVRDPCDDRRRVTCGYLWVRVP